MVQGNALNAISTPLLHYREPKQVVEWLGGLMHRYGRSEGRGGRLRNGQESRGGQIKGRMGAIWGGKIKGQVWGQESRKTPPKHP